MFFFFYFHTLANQLPSSLSSFFPPLPVLHLQWLTSAEQKQALGCDLEAFPVLLRWFGSILMMMDPRWAPGSQQEADGSRLKARLLYIPTESHSKTTSREWKIPSCVVPHCFCWPLELRRRTRLTLFRSCLDLLKSWQCLCFGALTHGKSLFFMSYKYFIFHFLLILI